MPLLRRAAALCLALLVFALPLALERCRTACVQGSIAQQPASTATAHACHDAADTNAGVVLSPSPRACGHSDDRRIADATALAFARLRVAIAIPPPALIATVDVNAAAAGPAPPAPPRRSFLDIPRNLPLRL